jgi:predicted transcriptional regulator
MKRDTNDLLRYRECRTILLSVRPKYAEQIIAGTKRVEFRRVWTSEPVRLLALYSTAPTSRVIAFVSVTRVIKASPTALWGYAKEFGGGVTRNELFSYMEGRKSGFALVLGNVHIMKFPIDPTCCLPNFHAPQSYRYLSAEELMAMGRWAGDSERI